MKYVSSYYLLFLFAVSMACSGMHITDREKMELAGQWQFRVDSIPAFSDSLYLPGTMDTNKKGNRVTWKDEPDRLTRRYEYKGKAWYQKAVEIPTGWKNREIILFMERTKPSHVYVDGRLVGSNTNVSSSQSYNLSGYLSPGRHQLTIMVDNGYCIPSRIVNKSHLYAEDTQSNWNGVIGDFYLEAMDRCHIAKVDVYPDFKERKAVVKVKVAGSALSKKPIRLFCSGESWNTKVEQKVRRVKAMLAPGDSICTITLDLGKNALTWSEFHPALYRLHIDMESETSKDYKDISFGLREFKTQGTKFTVNGNVSFLRGKVDCSISPLTGHTAMDVESWRHYFQVARQYGINHIRFHSWCPPDACFEAADIEGMYLQPETPYWGTIRPMDTVLIDFMTKEGVNIRDEYSNHASFVMYALGNELSGPQPVRKQILDVIRDNEDRHLYSYGSCNGAGFISYQEDADYHTTCQMGGAFRRPERHTRASSSFGLFHDAGAMNHIYPNTIMSFDSAVTFCPQPIISHESGQYQVYPNYDEIKKYTGVFAPFNFSIFKKRLEEAGMGDQAYDFFLASGKWAAELYCAEVEMYLRTKGFGGFQLLDLQDYPGQGTALIGILDAFMESKGLITPEEWRKSCCEVVPLFVASSYTHSADSNLQGQIKVANYSEKDLSGKLQWYLQSADGETMEQGFLDLNIGQGKLGTAGNLDIPLSRITAAEKCRLSLQIEGTPYQNDYPVWVYPPVKENVVPADVLVTDRLDSRALSVLKKGGKVLMFPDRAALKQKTVGGLFITDYWNYKMFNTRNPDMPEDKKSPGTMGLLMDPQHPLFKNFPTEFHSNWQWFPIVKEGYPMILDGLPVSYRPIVQAIDNIERNHKLGLVYEFNVEDGKLLVCMSDLEKYRDRPEVKQFRTALFRYMESGSFKPALKLSAKEAASFFKP